MDNSLWQDKSIEVLGTSLIDKLGSSLQEDLSKNNDDVDAFGSSITITKPTNSSNCFLDIQMENPSSTERIKVCSILNVIPQNISKP
jgi:hypothetical protein